MKRIDFKGKNVLITGASGGIGKALAKGFAQRGAHLLLSTHPGEIETLEQQAKDLETSYHIQTRLFAVDLLEPDGPHSLYDQVKAETGDIFALVNNAGMLVYGAFHQRSLEEHKRTITLNLSVTMELMYLFIQDMVKKGEGVIYNISSLSAFQPTPYHPVYGASKTALQSLSQSVRAELKGTGVTVCTLNPPYIDTGLLERDGFPPDLLYYSFNGKKSPGWLAKKAFKGFEKRKFLYLPGPWSAFIHLFLIKLSPRRLVDFFSRYLLQSKNR
jgi:short-subunit dehydrogenase